MNTECQVLTKAQKYSCQLYVILATDSHNLGRLDRRLFEVLILFVFKGLPVNISINDIFQSILAKSADPAEMQCR